MTASGVLAGSLAAGEFPKGVVVSSVRPVCIPTGGAGRITRIPDAFIVCVVVVHQFQLCIQYMSVVVQDGVDQVWPQSVKECRLATLLVVITHSVQHQNDFK